MKKPRIGDIVHYVSYGTPKGEYTSQCRAAVVAAVVDEGAAPAWTADLVVLNPEGLFFNQVMEEPLMLKNTLIGGTWHHRQGCDS